MADVVVFQVKDIKLPEIFGGVGPWRVELSVYGYGRGATDCRAGLQGYIEGRLNGTKLNQELRSMPVKRSTVYLESSSATTEPERFSGYLSDRPTAVGVTMNTREDGRGETHFFPMHRVVRVVTEDR